MPDCGMSTPDMNVLRNTFGKAPNSDIERYHVVVAEFSTIEKFAAASATAGVCQTEPIHSHPTHSLILSGHHYYPGLT